eukprot:12736668-Alexandrium_andersonii.AAC.1
MRKLEEIKRILQRIQSTGLYTASDHARLVGSWKNACSVQGRLQSIAGSGMLVQHPPDLLEVARLLGDIKWECRQYQRAVQADR